MSTIRLFDLDSYMFTFEATCVSALPHNDLFAVVLDQTAFFPEAGGQKADKGTISYELGGITHTVKVEDVAEKDGIITHFTSESIPKGSKVRGELDAHARFVKMQNHTAEHIISGLVHSKYGYANVGFHLADTYMTMDYDGPIDKAGITELETMANIAASANHMVKAWYPEDVAQIEYRSKKELEGPIRIVEIEGVDTCACCAPHVRSTAEVGLIKIIDAISYKGGVRITAVAGLTALSLMQNAWDTLGAISREMSLPIEKVLEGTLKLKDDLASARHELAMIKAAEVQKRIDELWNSGAKRVLILDDVSELNTAFKIMDELAEKDANFTFFAIFARVSDVNYRFMIKYKEGEIDVPHMKETLSASGGGKPGFMQGAAQTTLENILKYFA